MQNPFLYRNDSGSITIPVHGRTFPHLRNAMMHSATGCSLKEMPGYWSACEATLRQCFPLQYMWHKYIVDPVHKFITGKDRLAPIILSARYLVSKKSYIPTWRN